MAATRLSNMANMAAVYQKQCGEGDCSCSFLLCDMTLASEWANSAKKYVASSCQFRGRTSPGIDYTTLLPWKLTKLCEHEASFEKWCMIQLWLGLISTAILFVVGLIWHITEDLVPLGPVITNTLWRLISLVLFTWVMWFGVVEKKGCCWAFCCCFLGKPNLLAVSILSALCALGTLSLVIQGLGSGFALAIVASIALLVHGVAQVFMTVEAFMVWRSSLATAPASEVAVSASTVGDATKIGKVAAAGKAPEDAKDVDLEENADVEI